MFITMPDGCRLACEVSGVETGPPVLFVHGVPLRGSMWSHAAAALAGWCRCIVPDLRGHGASDASDRATMAIFADDLATVLDRLGEKRPVVLVGLSMGGIIAFEFFRRYRPRLRGLALCSTRATPETAEGKEGRERLACDVLARGSVAAAEAMIDRVMAPGGGVGVGGGVRDKWFGVMASAPAVGVAAAARGLAERADSRPTLALIDVPTLVVAGELDVITPADQMRGMAGEIRGGGGARFEVLRGVGHLAPVEAPEAFARLLAGWVKDLPA
jgi:pimeloyl-ACP methyl ester carboxylesterase